MTLRQTFLSGTSAPLTSLLMACSLGTAGQTANAAEPPAPGGSTTNAPAALPDVVVQGSQEPSYKPEGLTSPKYTEPLRDVPQTITVVPQAVIEQQGATTLRDVLRNVPGISFQAGEGGVPNGDNMSIRGFNARTDMFIDGVRDFGGYGRDSFNLEQVEVTKGPSSSNAGRGSTGGSVNQVSKSPQLTPFYNGSLGLGTEDFKRGTIDVNQPLKEIGLDSAAFRLNGMWTETGVAGRGPVENKSWAVAPSFSLGLGTPTRLTVSYVHYEQDNLPDYGIPWIQPASAVANPILNPYVNQIAPVDYSTYYGLKGRDYEKTRTDVPTVRLEHDFIEDVTLRNLTRYGQTVRDSVITAPRLATTPAATLPAVVVTRQLQSRDMTDTILDNQTDLTTKFDTFNVGHTLVGSTEFSHETSKNYARVNAVTPTTSLTNPDPNAPFNSPTVRNGAYLEAESDNAALSVFDTAKLSEKWQLNGGFRVDHASTDYKSVPVGGGGPTINADRTDTMPSWRAGLVFKPKPNGSIYASYGTSFNPSLEGLSVGFNAANVTLKPEESETYELGTKWDLLQSRLSVGAAVFRTEKSNARTSDPLTATVVVLDGKQHVNGLELNAAGTITEDWMVFAGYALMQSEITRTLNPALEGHELANTPEQTFSLWTTHKLPWKFEVGAGAQFMDARWSNEDNLRRAPGYWLGDAMLAYNATKSISLRLNVYNLTDENYIDRVGGGHVVPGTGRTAVVTANFKF